MPPTLGSALSLGVRALFREAWLVAPGLAVAGLRRALGWPALAFAWAILAEAAFQAARAAPLDPFAPVRGMAAVAGAPRALGIAGGLWLAGRVAGALLRVAWLAGALPALGSAMGGERGGPDRFAAGVAYRLPRVLATALLGLVAEVSGGLFAAALALGTLRLAGAGGGPGAAPLAAAAALALTLAVAVPVALSVAVDAAVARAAVLDEPAGAAFAGAARRLLARPGTFVLAALAFGVAGALAPALVEGLGGALPGAVAAGPGLAVAGATVMLVAAAGVSAAVDLAWLGTVAALACAEERG
ncbi:conserved hypothetical protein [Anaeromyxobacter dehalogenans 2CP-1]|uniref:Uncharacterized protein n=1 Tax=Anaeromyxobacter dehalogenans (strain ATCC BAA-258 / DSM 21875 / 2CP-1) TaxID=455488 RepID=B8JA58_ANAD2|nr:hypothetical protein [Anaeromyxobacter dehalogenans]ACL65577.1 conserved hypothetical protein [Anaeromyxobacter dehalogenans 2CP-1]